MVCSKTELGLGGGPACPARHCNARPFPPPHPAPLGADINWRFLQQMRSKFGDDWQRITSLSIIEEGPTGEK